MPRKTKAVKQEPQVDIGAEIFASLRELEKLKGIPVDYMVERLKQALTNAYRRDREDHRDVPADNVVVDLSEKGLSMHLVKTAVEEDDLEDLALEIPMDAARRYNPNVQPGEPVSIPVDIAKFGRIAAQTAKQVVIQGIREAERGAVYESYSSKAQELLTGTVSRIVPASGDVILRVGQGNEMSDAILRADEQIPGETYTEGQLLRVYVLDVRKNDRGPMQPRRVFRPEALDELAESIRAHGVLQPLSVRRTAGGYELIAGERRLRAAAQAGLTEVPCILLQMDDQESGIAALVENLQRQDLDFVEEAMGIAALMRAQNLSQEQTARLLGKSQSSVANKLRLLRHGEKILDAIREAGLTERHARALLKLTGEAEKREAIGYIEKNGLSVAATERYIETLLSRKMPRKRQTNLGNFLNSLTDSLAKIQRSGIPAVSERRETENQIVLTITIPKTFEK